MLRTIYFEIPVHLIIIKKGLCDNNIIQPISLDTRNFTHYYAGNSSIKIIINVKC